MGLYGAATYGISTYGSGGAGGRLQPQPLLRTGTLVTYTAVGSTDYFNPADDLVLHVKNGSGSAITVSLVDGGKTPAGSGAQFRTVTVAAGTDRFIYFPAALADPSTGLIAVSYSSVTSVTAALLQA